MPNNSQSNRTPLVSLMILIAMALGAYLILPNLFMLFAVGLTGVDLAELMTAINSTEPQAKYQWMLLVVQFLASAISFIVVPMIFIIHISNTSIEDYFHHKLHNVNAYFLVFCMMVSFMVVDSVFIEWNMNITFPEPFQTKFLEMEKAMEQATNFLTDFQSMPYFLLVFIAIAIVPAVGEELLFRGLIQKYALQIFGNIHVAIWVTAFVFSAFHLQFFGFLPRMLLGAFFGYLVYFSGSLWYGIAAHFLNNGMTVLVLYLHQKEVVDFDIESAESFSLEYVGIFAIIGVILMLLFSKQFQKRVIFEE